jgi:hypothetical protein
MVNVTLFNRKVRKETQRHRKEGSALLASALRSLLLKIETQCDWL